MSLLIKLLGEKRLSNIYREYASKQIKTGMKAEFQDNNGLWYYSFKDEQDLPITRSAKSNTYSQYLSAGLSGQMFEEAYDKFNELTAKGDHIASGVIINDLRELKQNIVNIDVIINIIAVNYVREDENPVEVNETIHQEKCDFLKTETDEGRFFFRTPEWVRLLNKAGLSTDESETFYQDYLKKHQNILKRWSILTSGSYKKKSAKKK